MRLVGGLLGGGIAAFFLFSWIIQMLFNSIVVRHLGLFKTLNYWQAAGLWFLVTLLTAWVGIGSMRRVRRPRGEIDWDKVGERIGQSIERKVTEWTKGHEKAEE